MKYYIASKFENKDAVRSLSALIEQHGPRGTHTFTFDWTKCDESNTTKEDAARNDLAGVIDARLFVMLWHPDIRCANVELGAALACVAHSKASRWICVIRCPVNEQSNVFFHHPLIKHFSTVEIFMSWFQRTIR